MMKNLLNGGTLCLNMTNIIFKVFKDGHDNCGNGGGYRAQP